MGKISYQSQICCKVAHLGDHHGHIIRRIKLILGGHVTAGTEHHIQNSGDFVNKAKYLEVPPGQKLVSYDVSALFTSTPVPDAIADWMQIEQRSTTTWTHPPFPQTHN